MKPWVSLQLLCRVWGCRRGRAEGAIGWGEAHGAGTASASSGGKAPSLGSFGGLGNKASRGNGSVHGKGSVLLGEAGAQRSLIAAGVALGELA